MSQLETVGIRVFGDQVSAYVRKAALGVRVFITDRGKVVAELRKPEPEVVGRSGSTHPLLHGWVQEGLLRMGSGARLTFLQGPPLLKSGTSRDLLDELRGER